VPLAIDWNNEIGINPRRQPLELELGAKENRELREKNFRPGLPSVEKKSSRQPHLELNNKFVIGQTHKKKKKKMARGNRSGSGRFPLAQQQNTERD